MNHDDRGEFVALITDALAFWRRDVSDFVLDVWWKACKGFSLDQVQEALGRHALDPDRGGFAPYPADVVRQITGGSGDRALVAWSKVHGAIGSAGAYASVAFDDPAIHAAVVDLGGWVAICQSKEADLPHLQRRFMDAHRLYDRRPVAAPPHLPGLAELSNRGNGRAVQRPVAIGDARKVAQLSQPAAPTRIEAAIEGVLK